MLGGSLKRLLLSQQYEKIRIRPSYLLVVTWVKPLDLDFFDL